MKFRFLLIIFFLGVTFSIFAQNSEKHTQFSPEFKVSFNMDFSSFIGGNYGFGVGLYNAFYNQKRCNLIVGLEYNAVYFSAFLLERDYYTPFYYYIGIPVSCRVNMGKKVKFFIEAGAFFDPLVIEKRIPFEKDVSTTDKTVYLNHPDFGFFGGVGLRIPVKKYEILIKSDYKSGMGSLFCSSTPNSCWRFAVGFKI